MQLFRLCSSVLLLVSAVACESPTDSGASSLAGKWVAPVENTRPYGSYQSSVTLGSSGSFTFEVRSFGAYAGQPSDEVSSYTRSEGTYRAEGDHLVFQPKRLITWDRFYGADSPETVTDPYPWGTMFDGARYELQGSQLTLRYTTYPADAPIATELVFTRSSSSQTRFW